MLVGQITIGMHVQRADGSIGLITGWKLIPGVKTMYNLEVAQDHTFTVGDGQWVVHNCGGETTTLYRAVDEEELNDVLHYGDYGLSPHGGGKYFAKTEEGAIQFANSRFNAGKRMTVTSMEIPTSWMEKGFHFYDPGGGNESIHFDDETLIDLYEHMSLPNILDASGINSFGS